MIISLCNYCSVLSSTRSPAHLEDSEVIVCKTSHELVKKGHRLQLNSKICLQPVQAQQSRDAATCTLGEAVIWQASRMHCQVH